MIQLESTTSKVNASQEKVFDFLGDFRNISDMLPGEIIGKVVVEENVCRFDIKGLGHAGLVMDEKIPFSSVRIKGTDDTPGDFSLLVNLSRLSENETAVKFSLVVKMNMFVEMMAKGPLQKFLDMLAEKVRLIS